MKLIRRIWPSFFLCAIAVAVAILNFQPNTWLTGWDNLHPEFNFFLNIKRSLFSVWQEYQGLGLVSGFATAADLPRQLLLTIFSTIVSPMHLRYLFTVSMLVAGPLGVSMLLQVLLPDELTSENKRIAGFLGGLFYLLNLATVQIFAVPFEAFVAHYGFLPWLLYGASKYLKGGSEKVLFGFFILSFLTTTQSYVPPLFIVYLLALGSLVLGILIKKPSKLILTKICKLFLVSIVANAFWLLPFTYFTLTAGSVVGEAHENFMATEDIYLRNYEFGTLEHVTLLRGFWFNFIDMHPNREFFYMASVWKQHLATPEVLAVGYFLFAVILLGLFVQLRSKNPFSIALLLLFFVPFTMLANATPPFSFVAAFIRDHIPLFGQAFRVPFTKFAVLAILAYSLLFACGVSTCLLLVRKYLHYLTHVIPIGLIVLLVIFSFPIFTGHLFYTYNRLSIPKEYFETMEFFQRQDPDTRIANFPQLTYWGWNHFTWGYRGSGFYWYGIPQPVMDRAFDGFSPKNENYYWELAQTLNDSDAVRFRSILEKYAISWLLIDENIISPFALEKEQLQKLSKMIRVDGKISLAANFANIKIYYVPLQSQQNHFISIAENLPTIEPLFIHGDHDEAYRQYGDYVSKPTYQNAQDATMYYPFRSLFTGRRQHELAFQIENQETYTAFRTDVPKDLAGNYLFVPKLEEEFLPKGIELQDSNKAKFVPRLYLDNQEIVSGTPITVDSGIGRSILEVRVPKLPELRAYDSAISGDLFSGEVVNCNEFNKGKIKSAVREDGERYLNIHSSSASACKDIIISPIRTDQAYLIQTKTRYESGRAMLFWSKQVGMYSPDIETFLEKNKDWHWEYFVVPPKKSAVSGYHLHFDNTSIGTVPTINNLARVTVYPIPYRFLTEMKIISSSHPELVSGSPQSTAKEMLNQARPELVERVQHDNVAINVEHPNESLYFVSLLPPASSFQQSRTLVLSQAYDEGWRAYEIRNSKFETRNLLNHLFPFLFGNELKDHVLVNNWANGWSFDGVYAEPRRSAQDENSKLEIAQRAPGSKLVIVYLPQYLEYIGFALLVGTFGYLVWRMKSPFPNDSLMPVVFSWF